MTRHGYFTQDGRVTLYDIVPCDVTGRQVYEIRVAGQPPRRVAASSPEAAACQFNAYARRTMARQHSY